MLRQLDRSRVDPVLPSASATSGSTPVPRWRVLVTRLWGVALVTILALATVGCHRLFADFGDGSHERDVEPPKPKSATDWVNEGIDQLNDGGLTPARDAFLRALALDPGQTAARLNLATIALRRGDVALALSRYEALAKVDVKPSDRGNAASTARSALRNIIRIRLWQGDEALAVAALKRFAAIARPAYVRQMRFYLYSRFPLSLKLFDEWKSDGKRKVPNAEAYNKAVVALRRALAGVCRGAKWRSLACDKVLRPLKMAFKRFTIDKALGFYEGYNNLAVTRCLLADTIRCKANLLAGLKFYANSSRMLFNRAVIELAFERGFFATPQTLRNRLNNAKVYLGKLLLYAPKDASAFYLEGVIALLDGSKDRAQKALAKFPDPASEEAKRLKRWIELY
ncbi:MAG: hypothetical protein KC609_13070 [Myxococcales bacterium]|nr:hypothetical protein [Myxococcales bacterium]